jgi:ATP-dependent RNA helicase DHX36
VEDVAYVIDTGLAKEKGYDAALKSSSLLPTFVAQANAMQRRGRAGRCRPGVCFHLYSKPQFDAMPKFQIPELLRTPLDELCLNARSILSNNAAFFPGSSVKTFLAKALVRFFLQCVSLWYEDSIMLFGC